MPVGAIYCNKPNVDRLMRLAPAVKKVNGTAVNTEVPKRSKSILIPIEAVTYSIVGCASIAY